MTNRHILREMTDDEKLVASADEIVASADEIIR